MNIFFLDKNPQTAAQYHCNKHVCKMILESAQLLSTSHNVLGRGGPLRTTHINHPCNVWVRASDLHYKWLFALYVNLLEEYKLRYHKIHSYDKLVKSLIDPADNIPEGGWIDPPQCMPMQYKCDDTVQAYRNYYIGEKASFARWTKRNIPSWFKEQNVNQSYK